MQKAGGTLLLWVALVSSGAAFEFCGDALAETGPSEAQTIIAEDGGEEEVLTDGSEDVSDDLENDLPRPQSPTAGFFVSVGYVLMSLGGAVLPFLFLLG